MRSLLALGIMGLLAGCAAEPSSPSSSSADGPFVVQAASFGTLFTIEPRRINLNCSVNELCTLQVSVTSSQVVTLDWGLNTVGIVLQSSTSCPQGAPFLGTCTIDLEVPPTAQPGRLSGELTISDLDSGISKTFRISGRVR
jgi:hypothetical protein